VLSQGLAEDRHPLVGSLGALRILHYNNLVVVQYAKSTKGSNKGVAVLRQALAQHQRQGEYHEMSKAYSEMKSNLVVFALSLVLSQGLAEDRHPLVGVAVLRQALAQHQRQGEYHEIGLHLRICF
jgi:hypothetical protein